MYLIKNMEKDDIVYLYDLFGTFAYQQSLEGDILNFWNGFRIISLTRQAKRTDVSILLTICDPGSTPSFLCPFSFNRCTFRNSMN